MLKTLSLTILAVHILFLLQSVSGSAEKKKKKKKGTKSKPSKKQAGTTKKNYS